MDLKKSTIYQIYPKSFKDSTGNGQGDIKGIIEKLDYLENLGIECIWITPIYTSPQKDNGYDISDYYNINPEYGTMEDFDNLVKESGKRNIKIMLDMVFNHTSTEHNWFKEALKGNSKYMNYYIFKDGKDEKPPTNWISKFGGSTWEYVPHLKKYYLHLFDKTQADLNWYNKEVRKEIYKVMDFWLEKGVGGFRFDVINLIGKPDIYENDYVGDGRRFYTDSEVVHKFLKDLNKETYGKYENIITVGEMSSTTIENCIRYSNAKEEELSMTFNFHHLKVDYKNGEKWSLKDFDFMELKSLFRTWQTKVQEGNGWNALFWCNHDQPRIVSRFGDDKNYHSKSAKMLATALHMMKGTPYVYQGEEIGMTNAYYDKKDKYRDVESINYYDILKKGGTKTEEIIKILQNKSRDNARTPMQWDNKENGSFTSGTPWIDLTHNYKKINVKKSLEDKNSIFYHYKTLIKLRKEYDVISLGKYEMILDDHEKIYGYKRKYKDEELLVLCNFYGDNEKLDIELSKDSKLLLSNYEDTTLEGLNTLRPYEAIVILRQV